MSEATFSCDQLYHFRLFRVLLCCALAVTLCFFIYTSVQKDTGARALVFPYAVRGLRLGAVLQ